MIHTTTAIKHDKLFGVVAKNANIAAVCILLETFAQFDEQLQKEIFDFIIQQTILHKQDWPYEADSILGIYWKIKL